MLQGLEKGAARGRPRELAAPRDGHDPLESPPTASPAPADSLAEQDAILQPLLEVGADLLPGDVLDPCPQLSLLLWVVLLGELVEGKVGRLVLFYRVPDTAPRTRHWASLLGWEVLWSPGQEDVDKAVAVPGSGALAGPSMTLGLHPPPPSLLCALPRAAADCRSSELMPGAAQPHSSFP